MTKPKRMYKEALAIFQNVSPRHPHRATILNNLGELYREIGDYDDAEPRCKEALAIRQEIFGQAHLETAQSLNNLALLYRARRDSAKAEPLYQEALAICQDTHAPPSATAEILNNLGELYRETDEFVKAEGYYQEALAICQKVLGQKHPATAGILNNLGELYSTMDEFVKAEGCYQEALAICQKVLRHDHPYTTVCLHNLGWLKVELKDFNRAKALAQQSAKARLAVFNNILSFTSEQQRFAYRATLDPYSLFAALDRNDAELATTVLRYKGVVLDSVIEDRRVAEASKSPQDQESLARLNADKQQLGELLLQTSTQPSEDINQKVEALENDVKQIEGRFATLVGGARQALGVTVEKVQAALPPSGALIEYIRYARQLGKGKWGGRYGAVVLASSGQPRWIPLASEKDVDAAVSQYQSLVRAVSDEGKLEATLQSLYAQLWAPIERALPPDTKQVIISPDGQLNFVSFATLLDSKEHFLAENYTVQYVTSGRDLLREASPPGEPRAAVVFANPDFGAPVSPTSTSAEETRSDAATALPRGLSKTEKRGLEGLRFDPLPKLYEEACNRLVGKFQGWHWATAPALTDLKASKAALRQVHGPYVLHLATHGYFMPDEPAASEAVALQPADLSLEKGVRRSKFFANPMHRSWLLLAGANVTLDAWGKGQVPPVDNDGIVTAEDISTLDLKGTWLVTLSACDTGVGEFKAGEGVLGLRRGVMQAGAQNLLMTLWPITGQKTTQIMLDFYEKASGGNAPQALADVQRAWLERLRDNPTQGLAQAVRLAGPFIMSFQGRPWARASALSAAPATLGQGTGRRHARDR